MDDVVAATESVRLYIHTEVPLPDETGRRKLVELYGKRLSLSSELIEEAVQRTDGASAAFIKELMRRLAQANVRRRGGASIESGDVSEALDDMLFAGGKLNVRLLGGGAADGCGRLGQARFVDRSLAHGSAPWAPSTPAAIAMADSVRATRCRRVASAKAPGASREASSRKRRCATSGSIT